MTFRLDIQVMEQGYDDIKDVVRRALSLIGQIHLDAYSYLDDTSEAWLEGSEIVAALICVANLRTYVNAPQCGAQNKLISRFSEYILSRYQTCEVAPTFHLEGCCHHYCNNK